jgi:hypothetical protein
MTLVINQLLDQKGLNDEQPKEAENEETIEDPPQESTMFLWDWCIDSDDEQIEEVFIGDTPVIKVAPKEYNLCNKGVVPNTYSSPRTNTALNKIIPPIPTLKPSTPTPITTNTKSNTPFSANNSKPSTFTLTMTSNKPNTPMANIQPNGSQPSATTSKPKMCALDYNVIEDMKKTKANISMYDIFTLLQHHDLILGTFNPNNP